MAPSKSALMSVLALCHLCVHILTDMHMHIHTLSKNKTNQGGRYLKNTGKWRMEDPWVDGQSARP